MAGKTAHGSKVLSMYQDTLTDPSKWDEIVEYCEQDVEITREMLARYEKVFPPVKEEVKPKLNMEGVF